MARYRDILFDAGIDGLIFSPSLPLISQGHFYEAFLGLAISGIKIAYDFKMLSENEPTTFVGLIKYRDELKECLIEGVKAFKRVVKKS